MGRREFRGVAACPCRRSRDAMADLTRLMPYRRAGRFVWRNLAVFVLIGATVVDTALFIQAKGLASDNRDRIRDVQAARLEFQTEAKKALVLNCLRQYESFRSVFRPFFRTKTQRTAKEQRNIDRFNNTVDNLKAGCGP